MYPTALTKNVITEATVTAAAFWQNQDDNTLREGEIHLVVVKGDVRFSPRTGRLAQVCTHPLGPERARTGPTFQLWKQKHQQCLHLPSIVKGGFCAQAAPPQNLLPQSRALMPQLCCFFWTLSHSTINARKRNNNPNPRRQLLALVAVTEDALSPRHPLQAHLKVVKTVKGGFSSHLSEQYLSAVWLLLCGSTMCLEATGLHINHLMGTRNHPLWHMF